MAPRDEDSRTKAPDAEHTPIETTSVEESHQEADEWAQNEGYTPLSDLHGAGVMFMALSPEVAIDWTAHTFHLPLDGNIMDTAHSEEDFEKGDAIHSDLQEEKEGGQMGDFRNLAEEALRALEDDYASTLRVTNLDGIVENKDDLDVPVSERNATKEEAITYDDMGQDEKNVTSKVAADYVSAAPFKTEPVEIDTAAIKRAVASIQEKDAKLSQRYEEWQQTFPPEHHAIIPSAPLAAFRKSTLKARHATANLSRSATIAHALHRLQILEPDTTHLLLHILGVDQVETQTTNVIRTTFGALVRWLAASPSSPRSVEIVLIGPNIVSQQPVDLLPSNNTVMRKSPLTTAWARCHKGTYHDFRQSDSIRDHPQLALAFNAGIWGYNEWIPTLDCLKGSIFVVTAYTLEEAFEDGEVLEKQEGASVVWSAETNPFGSNMRRETKSSDKVYRENAAWQAWNMQ